MRFVLLDVEEVVFRGIGWVGKVEAWGFIWVVFGVLDLEEDCCWYEALEMPCKRGVFDGEMSLRGSLVSPSLWGISSWIATRYSVSDTS